MPELGAGGGRIGATSRVTLHFSLLLESGEQVDGTRNGDPARFTMGDGSLPPGFETALVGLQAGDDARFVLEPERGFGAHNPANVARLSRERFRDMTLEPGLIVSFQAADGELPGVVRRVFSDAVEVDFNHPLAGRTLTFDVSIVAVEP